MFDEAMIACCDLAANTLTVKPIEDAGKNPFVEPINLLSSDDSVKYDAVISAIPEDTFVINVDAEEKTLGQLTQKPTSMNLNSLSREDLNQMVPCGHFCKNKQTYGCTWVVSFVFILTIHFES